MIGDTESFARKMHDGRIVRAITVAQVAEIMAVARGAKKEKSTGIGSGLGQSRKKQMSEIQLPGMTLLKREAGSTSYNLNVGESDVDYQLVYITPTTNLLGLERPTETVVGSFPNDYTAHEIGKFLRLVLKGNPTVTENLLGLVRGQDYVSGPFHELKANVRRLVSARTLQSYLGYAYGQLHKMQIKDNGLHSKGGRYNEKYGMHLIRLLINARQLATEGVGRVTVWFDTDSENRKELMKIRNGESSKEEVEEFANLLAEQVNGWLKAGNANVPAEPDTAWANEWLINLRKQH